MEYLKNFAVSITKDTNKSSDRETLTLGAMDEQETTEEFIKRVTEKLRELLSSD